MEKISTRGGVRPAVVASGDMMTLRPVGATIGPADLARRAAPRSGRFAGNGCGASLRPVGRSRGVPRASIAEPESPPESAAHESAAKGPLHLPFQSRGAHVVLRALLGTSVISRRRAPPKKSGVPGVDFFQTRANPGAGSEAHDDKSSPPAGRLARRRAARRKCVAEQNCDCAAAPSRGVQILTWRPHI